MDGTESLGISRTGQTVLARVMESHGSVGRGVRKGTMACLSVWEKAVPQFLP